MRISAGKDVTVIDSKIIESNRLYVISSTYTGRVYMDEQRTVYAFLNPEQAEEFTEEHPGTDVLHPTFYTEEQLIDSMYSHGADRIIVTNRKDVLEVKTYESQGVHVPTNHDLNGAITLLRDFKKEAMLKDLGKCEYLIPTKIKDGSQISYAVLKHPVEELGFLYLAFSDLTEFNAWAAEVGGYEPLKVPFARLKEIAKKSGLMINPCGNRVILTEAMLSKISASGAGLKEGE